VAVGLDGGPRLGGHHDDRAGQVTFQRVGDLSWVGGVEHRERHARGVGDHLGRERRTAHAREDDPVEPFGMQLRPQRLDLTAQRAGRLVQRGPRQPDLRLGLRIRAPQRGVSGRELAGDLVGHQLLDEGGGFRLPSLLCHDGAQLSFAAFS
jgi:hypothetical protein